MLYMVNEWQETGSVLREFGRTVKAARRGYVEFVRKGFSEGHRKELEGGGIFRSMGGVIEYLKGVERGRALACYWLVAELGFAGAEVASHLDITSSAVTVSVRRGRIMVQEDRLVLDS